MSTAISRTYLFMTYEKAGNIEPSDGSVAVPLDEATVPGLRHVPGELLSLPATLGAELDVYDVARDGPFERFMLRIDGGGICRLAVLLEDGANPGAKLQWQQMPNLSCGVPLVLNADQALTHATAANQNGDTGGSPSLWADGAAVTARVKKIRVKSLANPAAVILLRRTLHN